MDIAVLRLGAVIGRWARASLVASIVVSLGLQPGLSALAQSAPSGSEATAVPPAPALPPAGDNRPSLIPGAPGAEAFFGPMGPAKPDAGSPLAVYPRPERTSPSDWARPAEGPPTSPVGTGEAPGSVSPPLNSVSPPAADQSKTNEAQSNALAPSGGGTMSAMTSGSGDPFAGVIQNDQAGKQPELAFSGSYTTEIPIEVPAFRGLEPRVRLAYDSNRSAAHGNLRAGQVGVGWSLEGMPDIVRSSPIRGTPDFTDTTDATNRFTFEGEQLEPCVAGMQAASCLAGGTHTTRVESFQKIKRIVGTTITWEVTARDGTKFTFKPASTWGGGTTALATNYRWLLAEARDTSNNVVNYAYTCTAVPVCHPSQIKYGDPLQTNFPQINFTFETKPDVLTVATGASVASLDKRLRLIEVRNANARLRVYALNYDTSSATGFSRLTSVTQYGKDAVISGVTVTSGTALPPNSFTYQNAPGFVFANSGMSIPSPQPYNQPFVVADFNGDGKSDIAWMTPECSTNDGCESFQPAVIYLSRSTTTGHVGYGYTANGISEPAYIYQPELRRVYNVHAADMDGDGIPELIVNSKFALYIFKYDSTLNTFTQVYQLAPGGDPARQITPPVIGDFDGDGEASILTQADGGASLHIYFNSATSTYAANGSTSGLDAYFWNGSAASSSFLPRVADVNGDGKADIVLPEVTTSSIYLYRWNGSGFTRTSQPIPSSLIVTDLLP